MRETELSVSSKHLDGKKGKVQVSLPVAGGVPARRDQHCAADNLQAEEMLAERMNQPVSTCVSAPPSQLER